MSELWIPEHQPTIFKEADLPVAALVTTIESGHVHLSSPEARGFTKQDIATNAARAMGELMVIAEHQRRNVTGAMMLLKLGGDERQALLGLDEPDTEAPGNYRHIVEVDDGNSVQIRHGDPLFADTLTTTTPLLPLGMGSADCLPVIIHGYNSRAPEDERHQLFVSHNGRHSTRGEQLNFIAQQLVAKGTNPNDIRAFFGPAISGKRYFLPNCNFENEGNQGFWDGNIAAGHKVNPETNEETSGFYVDLPGNNLKQLLAAGVPEDNIELSGTCTADPESRYGSHAHRDTMPDTRFFTGAVLTNAA